MQFKIWLENIIINDLSFCLPVGKFDHRLVIGDVAKVDSSFSKDTSFYVASAGKGASIHGRYQNFKEFLKKNIPIEAPEVGIWQGEIHFSNGRHRFAVLRDMGFERLPFAVYKDEVEEFEELFGVA